MFYNLVNLFVNRMDSDSHTSGLRNRSKRRKLKASTCPFTVLPRWSELKRPSSWARFVPPMARSKVVELMIFLLYGIIISECCTTVFFIVFFWLSDIFIRELLLFLCSFHVLVCSISLQNGLLVLHASFSLYVWVTNKWLIEYAVFLVLSKLFYFCGFYLV